MNRLLRPMGFVMAVLWAATVGALLLLAIVQMIGATL